MVSPEYIKKSICRYIFIWLLNINLKYDTLRKLSSIALSANWIFYFLILNPNSFSLALNLNRKWQRNLITIDFSTFSIILKNFVIFIHWVIFHVDKIDHTMLKASTIVFPLERFLSLPSPLLQFRLPFTQATWVCGSFPFLIPRLIYKTLYVGKLNSSYKPRIHYLH